jgi:type II secretory pathway pseudopilin PulG
MIIIVIIGILAAIAIPSYLSYREKGKLGRALSELRFIETALSILAVDTGMWPHKRPVGDVSGNEVWDLNSPSAGMVATDGGYPGWDGPYLANVPRDPWGTTTFLITITQ